MSIPKIIHYCWFGGVEKPKSVTEYLKTWEKLKDYKIIEWNESNFNLNSCSFIKEAYKHKKWAFVSDYARLKVLQQYGGVYLDTDVEIKKNFDDLLDNKMFLGFIYDCSLGTAIIGSIPNHSIINDLVKLYEEATFLLKDGKVSLKFKGYEDYVTNNNNDVFTAYFIKNNNQFLVKNKVQYLDEVTIFPKEYFERKTFNSDINYSVHHCYGSWYKDNPNKRSNLAILVNFLVGDVVYDKLQCYIKRKKLPYYSVFKKHKTLNY
jgi:hypothetical protein